MEDILSNSAQFYDNTKSFNDWWRTVPEDLSYKSLKENEANKQLLNQVNYVFLNLHLAGKHDSKLTHQELRDWLHSGQVGPFPLWDIHRKNNKSEDKTNSFSCLITHQ